MGNSVYTFESVWVTLDRVAKHQAETDRQLKETDRLVKANALQINGISKNNGDAAEYFYNALLHGNKKMFG